MAAATTAATVHNAPHGSKGQAEGERREKVREVGETERAQPAEQQGAGALFECSIAYLQAEAGLGSASIAPAEHGGLAVEREVGRVGDGQQDESRAAVRLEAAGAGHVVQLAAVVHAVRVGVAAT